MSGSPAQVRAPKSAEQLFFLTRVERIEDGHWFYTASNSIRWKGKRVSVARAVWAIYNGYAPKGVAIETSCGIAGCINPEHLQLPAGITTGKVCPNCGGRKCWTSKQCWKCHSGKSPEPIKTTLFRSQSQVCPICDGPKSYRAATCFRCLFPNPKKPSSGTVCPECGGVKTIQASICMTCHLRNTKRKGVCGTESNYTTYGCRCDECRKAATKARSERKQAARAAIAAGGDQASSS